ncbi:hypothetical protein Tco_0731241 [Tanacetum coccineum]
MQGTPVVTDVVQVSQRMTEFETRVRRDTDEVYTRLDDEQTRRQLLAGRHNMWFRDRRAHAQVMSLCTTMLDQHSEIRELQSVDCRRQTMITEMLAADHKRQVTMPRKSSEDFKITRHYIPIMSHEFCSPIKEKLRNLEERYNHKGRVVFDNFTDLNYVRYLFHFVEFECLLEINEQVCPRFILEFYSQYRLSYSDEGQMFVEFVIQNQPFSHSLENFAQILDVPCEGACVFTDRWRLDELVYGIPSDGPYQTNPPSIEDIISSI